MIIVLILNDTNINIIYFNAFEFCISLENIDLSNMDSALIIDNNAFNGCSKLSIVNLSNIISFSLGNNNFNLLSLTKIICTSKLVNDILINKTTNKNIIELNTQKLGNSISYEIINKKYEKSVFWEMQWKEQMMIQFYIMHVITMVWCMFMVLLLTF